MAETDPIISTTLTLSAPIAPLEHVVTDFLAPLPPSHFLRAWERQPRPALSRSFRARTVWKKRWDLDRTALLSSSILAKAAAAATAPMPSTSSSAQAGSDSPSALRRVVKRRCIVPEDAFNAEGAGNNGLSNEVGHDCNRHRASKGTSWERRDSGRFRKRRIISERQQPKAYNIKAHNLSSPTSPLKVASSLAHQGLCFSSPIRQTRKQLPSPIGRRRSGSVDLLVDESNENVQSFLMPVSEYEDTTMSETLAEELVQDNRALISITNRGETEKSDHELDKPHQTLPNSGEVLTFSRNTFDDVIHSGCVDGDASHDLPLDQDKRKTAVSAELSDRRRADIDKLVRDTSIDEAVAVSSDIKSALDMHLVMDTALLKDFLDRVAVSKERKREDIAKQSSISHRRDSDAVRNALGSESPTKALGEGDPSSPPQYISSRSKSPDKKDSSAIHLPGLHDVTSSTNLPSEDQTFIEMGASASPTKTSRRSNRVRNNRVPQPKSDNTATLDDDHLQTENPPKTTKGKDKAPIKKTEAQELAQLTRKNSNKNKRGALPVLLRLADLTKDEEHTSEEQMIEDNEAGMSKNAGSKTVTWAENLVQYSTGNDQVCIVLKKSSYSTPRKPPNRAAIDFKTSSSLVPTSKMKSSKLGENQGCTTSHGEGSQALNRAATPAEKLSGTVTPRARRARGLGTTNGTPAKGLLASSILPFEVQDSKELSTNAISGNETANSRKQAALKKGKQNEPKSLAKSAEGRSTHPASKLVQPRVTGLSRIGTGKVVLTTPKSCRQR